MLVYLFSCLLVFLFQGRVSGSPSLLWTHYLTKDDVELPFPSLYFPSASIRAVHYHAWLAYLILETLQSTFSELLCYLFFIYIKSVWWANVSGSLITFDPILYFGCDYQCVMLPIRILICLLMADNIEHLLMYLLSINILFL